MIPLTPDKKLDSFKVRVGWDAVPGAEATDGVVADWWELAELLKPVLLPELRLESSDVSAAEPGFAELRMDFRRRSRAVGIRIYVSSRGTAHAREKLLSMVYGTNRMDIPHVRGPATLGEISLLSQHPRSRWLLWAFRNVCVDLRDEDYDTLPLADLIQAFMVQHLTPEAIGYAPTVDAVEITPAPIHVGDTVRVAVKQSLAEQLQLDDDYREGRPALLESRRSDRLALTYIAQAPGNTSIAITLVDRKTLLKTWTRLPLEILP